MIEFILGAFLYAKFKKKYLLKPIFRDWTIYLPLLAALFYIFLEITIWMRWYYFVPHAKIIKNFILLSYLPLVIHYRLYENNKYSNELKSFLLSPTMKAIYCLVVGSVFNMIAVHYNGGYMPVFPSNTYWTGYLTPELINDGVHVLGNYKTVLIPITDIFDVFYSVWSIGDVFVRLYAFIVVYESLKKSNKIIK